MGKFSDGSEHPLSILSGQTNYSSSNETVATIDSNGLITVHAKGISEIFVTNSGITSSFFVDVDACTGDFDLNGDINFLDLSLFADQWLVKSFSADYSPDGGDGIVNFIDWAVFADAWQSTPSFPNWNKACDLSPEGGDDVVDTLDLSAFVEQWMQYKYIYADIAPDDGDGIVNFLDFSVFAEYWLEGVYP
jgi:hypothetical protein